MSPSSTMTVRVACAFAAVGLILAAGRTAAQPAPADTLVPPVLQSFVEAPYPAEAEKAGIEGTVELLLTIDDTGHVTSVEVQKGAGYGFDEAARTAALQFVFEPARKGGKAIASKIGYRYVFELKAPPPSAPEPVPAPESAPAPTPASESASDSATFEARATVTAPPREVTRRTIGKEELTRIPGTRGDALRAVELLPGVGRPTFGQGLLLVRGSAPQDTGVFLDGSSVPLLYHFGGLTSFINSRLLDRIDFYPGNFSVRYGRLLGGVLEANLRDPATDGLHGVIDVNLIDASALVEGPVGSKASVAVAARRSYIDFFFDKVVPDDAFDVVSAPVYYDYQLVSAWRPTDADRLTFSVYGSSDDLELIFSSPLDSDPAIRGNFGQSTQFHRGQIGWHHRLSPEIDHDLMVSFGPTLVDFAVGDALQFDATFWQLFGRSEWTGHVNDRLTLRGGFDVFLAPSDIGYHGPPVQQTEGNPGRGNPFAAQPVENVNASFTAFRPAMYLESSLQVIDPLVLITGVRLDWFSEIASWAVNPRAAAILSINERTRLKGGIGLFSQPPDSAESSPQLGNPDLGPMHALHTSIGIEHDLLPGIQVGAEGYFKHVWDMVVGTPAGVEPRFRNDGVGRIYGLELSGRVMPKGRPFFAFVSYTLSRSQRRDLPGTEWRYFDFDQTHILTLAGVVMLGRGWETGAAFRLVSGNPDTPIIGGYFLEDRGVYVPLYGDTNSSRSATFHRLDVRLEKKWTFGNFKLAFYVDVQNVYNHANQEGLVYSYNFRESGILPGLPILPSIGLRGEL